MSKTSRNDFFDEDDAEVALAVLDEIKKAREQRGKKRAFTDADAARFGLKDAAQLHRPGWRHSPNVYARDAAIDAYSKYERELAGAYLLPQQGEHTGVGSHGPVEQRAEGDKCLIKGMNGHLQWIDGELQCVADDPEDYRTVDAATVAKRHRERMMDEYAGYEKAKSEEWRGGK
jgi:hypothetical protein